MAVDELVHGRGEAAELAQQLDAPIGVPLDHGELLVIEPCRLLQDLFGNRKLADVVEQPADRKRAQPVGGEAELFADLHRPQRDSPRVLFGRLVLLGKSSRQRANASAEESFLLRDELGRTEVAYE